MLIHKKQYADERFERCSKAINSVIFRFLYIIIFF